MKRMAKWLAVAVCAASVMFTGCSDGSSSSNMGLLLLNKTTGVPSVSVPSYSAGQIIKNKVVNLDSSTDEYYEYFEFTSATAGNYSLYKNSVKQTTYNNAALPTTFTYDADTGKFSTTVSGVTRSSYLFNAASDAAIAADLLTGGEDGKTDESGEWKTIGNVYNYKFDVSSKKCTVSYNGGASGTSESYENESGWIKVGSSKVKLYFGSKDKFYFNAYKTTRTSVSEVGRSIGGDEIVLESPVFILANLF